MPNNKHKMYYLYVCSKRNTCENTKFFKDLNALKHLDEVSANKENMEHNGHPSDAFG